MSELRGKIQSALKEKLDAGVTIHDFRMVSGPTHTNVIFDAVIPLTVTAGDAALKADVCRIVKEMDEKYFAVVTIDRPYVTEA